VQNERQRNASHATLTERGNARKRNSRELLEQAITKAIDEEDENKGYDRARSDRAEAERWHWSEEIT
jgi:hypothetical protein